MKSKYVILIGLSILLIPAMFMVSCAFTSTSWDNDNISKDSGVILIGMVDETPDSVESKVSFAFRRPYTRGLEFWKNNVSGDNRINLSSGNGYFVAEKGIYSLNHIIIHENTNKTATICYSSNNIHNYFDGPNPDSGYVVLPGVITYIGSIRGKTEAGSIKYDMFNSIEEVKKWAKEHERLKDMAIVDQSHSETRTKFYHQENHWQDIMSKINKPPVSNHQGGLVFSFPDQADDNFFPYYCLYDIKREHTISPYSNYLILHDQVRPFWTYIPGKYELVGVRILEGYSGITLEHQLTDEKLEFLIQPNSITYGGSFEVSWGGWTISDNSHDNDISFQKKLKNNVPNKWDIFDRSTSEQRLLHGYEFSEFTQNQKDEKSQKKKANPNNIAKLVGVAAGVALVGMTDLSAADKLNVGLDVATTIVTGESTNSSSSTGDGSLTSGANEKGQFAIEPSSGSSGSSFDAKPIQTSKPKQQTTKMIVAVAREKTRCNYTDLGIVWKRGSGTMAELKSIASKTAARQYPDYDKIEFKDSVEWGENCNYLVIISGTTKNSDNCERFTFGVGFGQNRSIAVDNALVYLNGMNWDWNETRDGFEVVHEEAF